MKRTYQPNTRKRAKNHGFRHRMSTRGPGDPAPSAPERPAPPERLERAGVLWRIRDRATFEALRHSGERARRGPLSVTYVDVGDAPVPRVAYAVGRRVGNAVARNRLRRRLRAATSEVAGLAPGAYLVSAGPGATRLAFEDLKREVADAMNSASRGRAK